MPPDLGSIVAFGLAGYVLYIVIWEDLLGRGRGRRKASPPPPPEPVRALPRRGFRRRELAGAAIVERPRSAGSAGSNALNAGSAQQEAENASVQRSAFSVQRSPEAAPALVSISSEELTQLARAIELKANGATKQAAIEQAFSCSKGAGRSWRRAVALFDLASGEGE